MTQPTLADLPEFYGDYDPSEGWDPEDCDECHGDGCAVPETATTWGVVCSVCRGTGRREHGYS